VPLVPHLDLLFFDEVLLFLKLDVERDRTGHAVALSAFPWGATGL